MSASKAFLKELVKSNKLERILSVEIQHTGLDTYKSIHHKIRYIDNSGVSENLSISIQDLEGFFGVILHEHNDALKLVYKNKNKVKEKWNEENDDTTRFIIPDSAYRFYDFEENDEIYRVFELQCEVCIVRVYVKVNSESASSTAYTRFRGKFKDMHERMEFYPIEAKLRNKLTDEIVPMHAMRGNGFFGGNNTYIFYTNQIEELDECKEYHEPERQSLYIRMQSTEPRNNASFEFKVSVMPQFHYPNDESTERFTFVVDDFIEGLDSSGCWAVFEEKNYSLTLSIKFDTPLHDRIDDIVERFKE